MTDRMTDRISGHRLARSVLWNLLGTGLPLLVGLVVVPLLVAYLGVERLGVLSIVWMLIGYFSVFDLGLGRALTRQTAELLGQGRTAEIPAQIGTAALLIAGLGAAGGVVLALAAPAVSGLVTAGSPHLTHETTLAMLWLALTLPFVLASVAFAGVLEAHQRFDLLTAVRIPLGVLNFLVPLALLPFSPRLDLLTLVIGLSRVLFLVVIVAMCLAVVPGLRRRWRFDRAAVRPMIRYGGWLTVSNLVGPLMVYFDRFLIAAVLGAAAVAYYTVPYEVLTKLWIVPAAVGGALFPALVEASVRDSTRMLPIVKGSFEVTALLLLPPVAGVALLAPEALGLWVGPEFSRHSGAAAFLLALGVLLNSFARIPFTHVQSRGRADWSALVHVFELPFYVLALWWLTRSMGIVGAALAWTLRVAVDTVIFYIMAVRLDPVLRRECLRQVALAGTMSALLVAAALWPAAPPIRLGAWLLASLVLAVVAWQRYGRLRSLLRSPFLTR